MLRVIIIEDEPATARLLQAKLQMIEPMEFVAVLDAISSSVQWLTQHTEDYDLIFMDIRLSDGLSIDIFSQVSIKKPVIFVTAYEEYMLSAFKTTGIDYILKPFDENELKKAMDKYHTITSSNSSTHITNIQESIQQVKQSLHTYKQSFLVHYRNKLLPIMTKDIACIFTTNEVSYALTFDKQKYILDFTLEELHTMLSPTDFFRANRQYIIQRRAIRDIDFYFNGRLLVNLNIVVEEKILVSKARVPEFKNWMAQ